MNPMLRDAERHDFWTGLVMAVIGVVLIGAGARHLTGVETLDETSARETELIKAFSTSGLKYASQLAVAEPPKFIGDPAASAEALDRWARNRATATPPSWKIRVDTEAKTPCPT